MPSALEQRVIDKVNGIPDPCSLAQRLPVGLADMGLVTSVEVDKAADEDGRHGVKLVLRVTAPGCMYMPFMDKAIKVALAEMDEVGEVKTDWDPDADWSPRDMAEPVQRRIAAARAKRRAELVGA